MLHRVIGARRKKVKENGGVLPFAFLHVFPQKKAASGHLLSYWDKGFTSENPTPAPAE